jgi:MerR family transcriptional regulator, copper efflux regulator
MNIGEFAKSAGVSPSKVRFYEGRGLLLSAPRRENGYREYEAKDLKRLLRIKRAQALGFSLDEIAAFLALSTEEQRAKHGLEEAAEAKLGEIDRHLAEVQKRRGEVVAFIDELRARKQPRVPRGVQVR